MNNTAQMPRGAYEPADVPLLLLGLAARDEAGARLLAREAGLPGFVPARSPALVPAQPVLRLWELAEHRLGSHVGLTAADGPQPKHFRGRDLRQQLHNYLISTAATFREAMQVGGEFAHFVTTSRQVRMEADNGSSVTYSYRHLVRGGRGEELWTQFSMACLCARAQEATGRRVNPVRIAFAQPPPRSLRRFAETFGTRRIDFGAPITTITLRADDVDAPMLGADPVLAAILRRFAGTIRPPPAVAWHAQFQDLLDDVIANGNPSLGTMARRLGISPRTLQRVLARFGTTWRAELDTARQRRADRARHTGEPGMAKLASLLGYADARSLRRAIRRWEDSTS